MYTPVCHRVQPLPQVLFDVLPVIEDLAIKAIVLDVLDPGLDLALAFRIIALTGVNAEPRPSGIGTKGLVKFQLPVLLVQHHQRGLVIDALFWPTSKVTEGRIMQPDEGGCVHRLA